MLNGFESVTVVGTNAPHNIVIPDRQVWIVTNITVLHTDIANRNFSIRIKAKDGRGIYITPQDGVEIPNGNVHEPIFPIHDDHAGNHFHDFAIEPLYLTEGETLELTNVGVMTNGKNVQYTWRYRRVL